MFALPQVIVKDSTKKSSDVLPFAPFLKPEIIKQQILQKEKRDSIVLKPKIEKADPVVAKAPVLKDAVVLIPKKDSLNQLPVTTSAFRFDDKTINDTSSFSETHYKNAAPIFSSHLLNAGTVNPKPFKQQTPDWFTGVLILIVIAFTVIKVFYTKIFKQMFSAFFNNTVTNQVVRDENVLVQRASILLSIIFYFIASLFLYQVSIKYNWDAAWMNEGFSRFIIFALLISLGYSIKMLGLKILSFIFNIDKPVATYIFNIFLINNMLGIFLIPIVAVIAYVSLKFSDYAVQIAIAIVALTFVYQLVRATIIWKSIPRFSLFYLFLYFCTLEFAPLLLIVKIACG